MDGSHIKTVIEQHVERCSHVSNVHTKWVAIGCLFGNQEVHSLAAKMCIG